MAPFPVTAAALLAAALPFVSALPHGDPTKEEPAFLGGESVGIAYSGFREGQHPDRGDGAANPSRAETLEDLRLLSDAGIRLIRLYDSGENSQVVLELIDEHNLPVRVLLGAWLRAEVSNHLGCPWLNEEIPPGALAANARENASEIGRTIRLAARFPEAVLAVNVGNEAMVEWNDHMVPPDRVIGYVRTVQAAIDQPVTVADNWALWLTDAGKAVAAELDFVGVHSYPVWEGGAIDEGLARTVADVERVREALPGAKLAVLEAGWASLAAEFGERASETIQTRYVEELGAWAGESETTVFLFEAFDEPWKGDPGNPWGAEKHWGLWNVDRSPKPAAGALREVLGKGSR